MSLYVLIVRNMARLKICVYSLNECVNDWVDIQLSMDGVFFEL